MRMVRLAASRCSDHRCDCRRSTLFLGRCVTVIEALYRDCIGVTESGVTRFDANLCVTRAESCRRMHATRVVEITYDPRPAYPAQPRRAAGRYRGARWAVADGAHGDRARDSRPGRHHRTRLDRPALRRSCVAGGHAGPGQVAAGGDDGGGAGAGEQAHPVHPRPDAGRYPGQRGAGRRRGRSARVPVPARPGVLPIADGRRDQPRLAAHAIGPAPGDAGGPRVGGRRGACLAASIPCAGHTKPHRTGRHLSAAGSAVGSVFVGNPGALSLARRRTHDAAGHHRRP